MRTTQHLSTAALTVGTLAIAGTGAALAATASTTTHTLSFTSKQTAMKQFGPRFVAADQDVTGGHVVGEDVLSAKVTYTKKIHSITGSIAIALKDGEIYATITGNPDTGALTGTLTGGAGKYKSISGTISGTAVGNANGPEHVVVRYH